MGPANRDVSREGPSLGGNPGLLRRPLGLRRQGAKRTIRPSASGPDDAAAEFADAHQLEFKGRAGVKVEARRVREFTQKLECQVERLRPYPCHGGARGTEILLKRDDSRAQRVVERNPEEGPHAAMIPASL